MSLATESNKWLHIIRTRAKVTRETNIGYGYHSFLSARCVYCLNLCSPFQSFSGCKSWDNDLGGCKRGYAPTPCEDSNSPFFSCLGSKLKNGKVEGESVDVRYDRKWRERDSDYLRTASLRCAVYNVIIIIFRFGLGHIFWRVFRRPIEFANQILSQFLHTRTIVRNRTLHYLVIRLARG